MRASGNKDEVFYDYDEYKEEYMPEPGWFLEDHDVLEGETHLEFHEVTREIFEERGVYDMTFGYNLAKLNLDRRHPDAGYRYAEESSSILRAEFTPTTEFCPQAHTLTIGSQRAWNGLSEQHSYDVVRVRVSEIHHNSEAINKELTSVEDED